jgi:sulfopyruvate decarboxylase TPP-binding subunit
VIKKFGRGAALRLGCDKDKKRPIPPSLIWHIVDKMKSRKSQFVMSLCCMSIHNALRRVSFQIDQLQIQKHTEVARSRGEHIIGFISTDITIVGGSNNCYVIQSLQIQTQIQKHNKRAK